MDLARKFTRPGDEYYLLGRAAELRGDHQDAVHWYKKAEKLGHPLTDPEEISVPTESEPATAVEQMNEEENLLDTSPQLRETLSRFPHALDFQFSDEQKRFLDENGYLVIKKAVPSELCQRMVAEMWSRAKTLYDIDEKDPYSWAPLGGDGFVDIWHGAAYTEIRQSPILYSIFAQLLKCAELTVSLDRVCMKPPMTAHVIQSDGSKKAISIRQRDLPIHNDMNLWNLSELKYQGGLALSDCPKGHGGFRCIPGFHKLAKIREYRERWARGEFHDDASAEPPRGDFTWFMQHKREQAAALAQEIEMEMGDFVVWNSRLPHSNCTNKSEQCYVRYIPTANHRQYTEEIADAARSGLRPVRFSTGGFVGAQDRDVECKLHSDVKFSELGKKLHGMEAWN